MENSLLLGLGRAMISVPRPIWQRLVRKEARTTRARLVSLPDEHSVIHYFVVREIARVGKPLSPEYIAQRLRLSLERVNSILEDLERRLTFLFRDQEGSVVWAYPVTADVTPHHITLGPDEQIHAA